MFDNLDIWFNPETQCCYIFALDVDIEYFYDFETGHVAIWQWGKYQ